MAVGCPATSSACRPPEALCVLDRQSPRYFAHPTFWVRVRRLFRQTSDESSNCQLACWDAPSDPGEGRCELRAGQWSGGAEAQPDGRTGRDQALELAGQHGQAIIARKG